MSRSSELIAKYSLSTTKPLITRANLDLYTGTHR